MIAKVPTESDSHIVDSFGIRFVSTRHYSGSKCETVIAECRSGTETRDQSMATGTSSELRTLERGR